MKRLLALALLALLAAAFGSATHGASLGGLVIEDLDNDGTACGISTSPLESAAKLMLLNNGVKIDSSVPGFLYVRVRALNGGSTCFASVEVALKVPTSLPAASQFKQSKDSNSLIAGLCQKGNVVSGQKVDFSKRVGGSVEDLTKECLRSVYYQPG